MKKSLFISFLLASVAFQYCAAPITHDKDQESDKKEYSTERVIETKDASGIENIQNAPEKTLEKDFVKEKNEPSYSEWPCEDIAKTFTQLYFEKNTCEKDEDCILLGVKGTCDCLGMIYRGFFTSVPKKEEAFRLLHDRFFSLQCFHVRKCEVHFSRGPSFYHSKCENHRCKAVLLDGFNDACF